MALLLFSEPSLSWSQIPRKCSAHTWKCWAEERVSHWLFAFNFERCIFSHYGDIFLFCGPWWFLYLPLTRLSLVQLIGAHLVLKQKYFITPISTKPHLSLWFETSHVFWSISTCTQLELYRALNIDPSILFCKLLEMRVVTHVRPENPPGLL